MECGGGMIAREIINHMSEDELRNYVCHCERVMNATLQLCTARSEVIQSLRQVIINIEYENDSLISRNCRIDEMKAIEDKLENKYSQYLPRPMCGCTVKGVTE